jgi:NDP-sugar pyrophosphorylase family protein
MKAVILAGGKGTRLAPYTRILPKPLMPVGEMPILEILIRQFKCEGVDEVILTVGHMAGLLRAFFNEGDDIGVRVRYSYEENPLGTAGPLALVEGLDENTFIVSNGDVLTTLRVSELVRFHKEQGAAATIAMHRRKVKVDLGVILQNGGHDVVGYIEKPTYDYSVSMGIYVFEPRVLKYIPAGEYLDFPNLVHRLLGAREKVVGYPFEGYWQDLGRPDDYEQANLDFERMRAEFLPEG